MAKYTIESINLITLFFCHMIKFFILSLITTCVILHNTVAIVYIMIISFWNKAIAEHYCNGKLCLKAQKSQLFLQTQNQQRYIFHICKGLVCLHTYSFCCSPGSFFQEPLITSFSHCCWQFSTSVLWEPLLHGIVFFLSAFFLGQRPVHTS